MEILEAIIHSGENINDYVDYGMEQCDMHLPSAKIYAIKMIISEYATMKERQNVDIIGLNNKLYEHYFKGARERE